jgi:hypothetical protein
VPGAGKLVKSSGTAPALEWANDRIGPGHGIAAMMRRACRLSRAAVRQGPPNSCVVFSMTHSQSVMIVPCLGLLSAVAGQSKPLEGRIILHQLSVVPGAAHLVCPPCRAAGPSTQQAGLQPVVQLVCNVAQFSSLHLAFSQRWSCHLSPADAGRVGVCSATLTSRAATRPWCRMPRCSR